MPNVHMDFILSMLRADPDSTVIDIGAGTGGWAVPMARYARTVTALEPSHEMIEGMKETIEQEGTRNVEIIQGSWPETDVGAQVAYAAMLQMGVYAHVLMGKPDQWDPWTNAYFEEAMAETTRRFKLPSPSEHDAYLDDLLKSRLTCRDGRYVWPSEVRSALIYWNGSANSTTSVTACARCTMRTRA